MESEIYALSAQYYDTIYSFKDYAAETDQLIEIIEKHLKSEGRRLLDVGCGTGHHLEYFMRRFEVEGLDINRELLKVARKRLKGVPLHRMDMVNFNLGQKFDVITCLFSAIGYAGTVERLVAASHSMARHLSPGGLVLIEPWFTPDTWKPNTVHSLFIDEDDFKLARINTSLVEGRRSIMKMHYLVGTPLETIHFVEHHEMGLFEHEEMVNALNLAGFEVFYEDEGITGRGLFIGRLEVKQP